MSHPDLITTHLGDEEAVATVNLSGEDALVITPTRSLRYESEGILSDESVTVYPHDVDAIAVSDGRRKTTITFEYPIEGDKALKVAKNRKDTVLHYVLAGVFHANGITRPGETVQAVFQFNELTLVVSSERVLTHVGSRVWDDEYEEYPFEDLTGLEFEAGSIATEIVLYLDERTQRVKVPNARAEEVKHELRTAVVEYFDVASFEDFQAMSDVPAPDTDPDPDAGLSFDDAVRPLGADPEPVEPPEADDLETWPYEATDDAPDDERPDVTPAELAAIVERLQAQLVEQRELLEAQEQTLDELADLFDED